MKAAYQESIEDCGGSDLPNLVLADLGTQVAHEYEHVNRQTSERIFELIETAIADEGELGTAVATGLIESLVGEAERMNLWGPISESFGKHTRAYIDAWFAQQESIGRTIASGR